MKEREKVLMIDDLIKVIKPALVASGPSIFKVIQGEFSTKRLFRKQ